jgi:DeoR family transcriptional regulator, L-fucose operon activator
MLPADRQQQILELLERDGSVRTVDLAHRLRVTDETIRRDLGRLDEEGRVTRTHGGAVRRDEGRVERSYDERRVVNIEAKRIISRLAQKLLVAGETVYFDASSTAFELARVLEDFPLRVLTHSLGVADHFASQKGVELHLLGGRYDRASNSFLGAQTVQALQRFRIDKMVCSANGIEPGAGVSEINAEQAYLKEIAAQRANSFLFLADRTKLGVSSLYYFATSAQVDHLITDASANHPVLEELAGLGLYLHTPDELEIWKTNDAPSSNELARNGRGDIQLNNPDPSSKTLPADS